MPLNSHLFLLAFLPVAGVLYAWASRARSLRTIGLVVTGLAFYAWAGVVPLLVLLGMTVLTFAATRVTPGRPRLGLALLLLNLVPLALCKYYDPLLRGLGLTSGASPALGWALPLGLSFFTFNLIGHGLDVYWGLGQPADSLGQLTAYASFFPTVSSGPLMRFEDFRSQLQAGERASWADVDAGVFRIALGLAKKVLIADGLGAVVDPLFADPDRLRLGGAWIAVLGEHFRIYLDFSGYTDIAIGAALLLGIRVPPNFDAPYTARSLTEFWRRWHMTLSSWFRDYVFFPLAIALRGLDPRRRNGPAQALSLLATMILIGLWHAPTLTYLVWGAATGVVLATHAALKSAGRGAWPAWAGRSATFIALLAGWVLLKSPTLDTAGAVYAALLGARGVGTGLPPGVTPAVLLALALLLVLTNVKLDAAAVVPPRSWIAAAATALLLTLGLLALGAPQPFVYLRY